MRGSCRMSTTLSFRFPLNIPLGGERCFGWGVPFRREDRSCCCEVVESGKNFVAGADGGMSSPPSYATEQLLSTDVGGQCMTIMLRGRFRRSQILVSVCCRGAIQESGVGGW